MHLYTTTLTLLAAAMLAGCSDAERTNASDSPDSNPDSIALDSMDSRMTQRGVRPWQIESDDELGWQRVPQHREYVTRDTMTYAMRVE